MPDRTAELMGDPAPEQSALAKRNGTFKSLKTFSEAHAEHCANLGITKPERGARLDAEQESEVIRLRALNFRHIEIAETLDVSESMVRTCVRELIAAGRIKSRIAWRS